MLANTLELADVRNRGAAAELLGGQACLLCMASCHTVASPSSFYCWLQKQNADQQASQMRNIRETRINSRQAAMSAVQDALHFNMCQAPACMILNT